MISIIHPSRSRVSMAAETKLNWLRKADNPEGVEYLMVCDEDDPELFQYQYRIGNILVCKNKNTSCIDAINFGALHSSGNLLVTVSDDFNAPDGWDTLLLEATADKEDFCLKVNDGMQPWIITLPIMDRKYYSRFNYIYHPGFLHMFADTCMTAVAWMLGRYIEVPLTFIHDHYSTGRTSKDSINSKNDSHWDQGKRLFRQLRRLNFELNPNDIINQELPEHSGLNIDKYR